MMRQLDNNVYVIDVSHEDGEIGLTGEGKRWRVDLLGDGRHWYFLMTADSLDITVPDENKPQMAETVEMVDRLSRVVTEMKLAFNYEKIQREEPEHE